MDHDEQAEENVESGHGKHDVIEIREGKQLTNESALFGMSVATLTHSLT
jgi:hypothetical protein